MVLWIGVDDTDSLRGMCTTFLATELVRELTQEYDLIGYPRLVRLNPNIPWKTRGNGAICLRVGRGLGSRQVVGNIESKDVVAFARASGPSDLDRVRDVVAPIVERWSHFEDETTNPGFAVLRRPPSARLYWKAVRSVVEQSDALKCAAGLGRVHGYKDGRGVIGSLAATAWRPRDRTYEILAYRDVSRWGTPRQIDPESVIEMDRQFPSTFNNFDYESGRPAIVPRSPCPVLYGVRGDSVSDLPRAAAMIRGERPSRWLLFETNQGTDDHVLPGPTDTPWTAGSFSGTVSSGPRTLVGGHVVFRMADREVIAYEPSKRFREVVRALIPGDRVRVVASVRDRPRVLNLEKLGVIELLDVPHKVANPRCPSCGKRMKSRGRLAGFRCVGCHTVAPLAAAIYSLVSRTIKPGWYEPPVCSRRHLSKPLKRGPPTLRESGGVIARRGNTPVFPASVQRGLRTPKSRAAVVGVGVPSPGIRLTRSR